MPNGGGNAVGTCTVKSIRYEEWGSAGNHTRNYYMTFAVSDPNPTKSIRVDVDLSTATGTTTGTGSWDWANAATLVTTGQFTMLGVTLAGAIGNVAGSVVAYYAGVWGGRPFVERYGPYVLVSRKDIEMADRWFAKYGDAAVFFSRMLPVVRTFISLPAGIARVNIYRFMLYTFLGALPWCYLLAYIGLKMGEQWEHLRDYFHQFDIVIGVCLAIAVGYFLWSHWPKRRVTPGV